MQREAVAMSFADYQKIKAANWSTLKVLHRDSPLHYKAHLERLARGEDDDTEAKANGRAVHAVILEPDEFPRRYVVMPKDADPSLDRRKAEGKARFAAWLERHPEDRDIEADAYRRKVFIEANPGRELITPEEYATCLAIRDVIHAHPDAARFLDGARFEQVITWTERVHLEAVGAVEIPCKARVDILCERERATLDLKRVRTADKYRFAAQAETLGYFHQAAFYRRGLKKNGFDLAPMLLPVEGDHPHDLGVFEIHATDLQAADADISSLLLRLAHHRHTNTWPGRYQGVQVIERPRWAYPFEEAA